MYILTFLIIFLSNFLLSAQLVDENTSTIKIITETKLPDGTIYQSFKVRGGSRHNTGKYATNTCSGHRVFREEKLLELRNICEFDVNDGHKYWSKAERSQSDVEVGVGKSIILDGTGPYKAMKGAQCLYALSFHQELAFTNIKCAISDALFNKLKGFE